LFSPFAPSSEIGRRPPGAVISLTRTSEAPLQRAAVRPRYDIFIKETCMAATACLIALAISGLILILLSEVFP
jgi:hypothetical protein